MAINPTCDRCGKELTEYGAILFGPPDRHNLSLKFHLCVACYEQYSATLRNLSLPDADQS